jgi:hypothetical protein
MRRRTLFVALAGLAVVAVAAVHMGGQQNNSLEALAARMTN